MSFFEEITGSTSKECSDFVSEEEKKIVEKKIRAAKDNNQEYCEIEKNIGVFYWLQTQGFLIYPILKEKVERCIACSTRHYSKRTCIYNEKCPVTTYKQQWFCCWAKNK